MKQRIILILTTLLLLSGCANPINTDEDPFTKYTEAYETVSIQLTNEWTPLPSATSTATPEPTITSTPTLEPSPTIPTTTPTWVYNDTGEVRGLVLQYHSVADSTADDINYSTDDPQFISAANFHQQMEVMFTNGFTSVSATQFIDAIKNGAEMPERPVVITFDTNSRSIITVVLPVLQEFGFVGNVFLIANQLNESGMLSSEDIAILVENGWSIGCRGMTGMDVTLDHSILAEEVSASKLLLEEQLGIPIKLFAYPLGKIDDIVLPRVSEWGYDAAFGKHWYDTNLHNQFVVYHLSRSEVLANMTVQEFAAYFPWRTQNLPTTIP